MLARFAPLRRSGLLIAIVSGFLALAPAASAFAQATPSSGLSYVVHSDLVYAMVDGSPISLDVWLPDDGLTARPVVVVVHGGGWIGGDKADEHRQAIADTLARDGFVVASINYSLAPDQVFPQPVRDIQDAIAWLRDPAQVAAFGIDPAKIAALGDSSGGNLVGLVGTMGDGPDTIGSRVAAVVSLSGPMSFEVDLASGGSAPSVLRYLGCIDENACPNRTLASPTHYVDPTDPPFLLVNGTEDTTVTPLQVDVMAETLDAAGVGHEDLVIPGGLHGSYLWLDPYVQSRVLAFLHDHLGA
ncbi:MAG: alpha/beta hydrolase [Thermomicrobiales bacterium]